MGKIHKIPITEKQKEQLLALGFDESEIDNQTLIDVTLYKQALNGNVTALSQIKQMLEALEDEPEEKPFDISKEVKKEERKLLKMLSGLSPLQIKVNAELIHNVAFQSVTLRHLAKDIEKNGVKEKYKNGANQWGYKDRTEVKTYNSMVKNYQACMKQLNDLIAGATGYADDGFDDF